MRGVLAVLYWKTRVLALLATAASIAAVAGGTRPW
jgi:hypothetical protein